MSEYDEKRNYAAEGYEEYRDSWLLRDPVSGAIKDTVLLPGTAEAMGKTGGKTLSKSARETAEQLSEALISVLVDPDDEKAEALSILLKQLSKATSKDASHSIRAIENALTLVGSSTHSKMQPPAKDEKCPLCGRESLVATMQMTPGIQRMLDEMKERYG